MDAYLRESTRVSILVFVDSFATKKCQKGILRHGMSFNPCFRRLSCNFETGAKKCEPPHEVSILVFVDSPATDGCIASAGAGGTVSILVFVDSPATMADEKNAVIEGVAFQSLFS